MAVEMSVTCDGHTESIDLSDLELTTDLARAVGKAVKATDAPNFRQGWAMVFHGERDSEARRRLLAALKFGEQGLAGVVFEELSSEVLVRFIRIDGREMGERFPLVTSQPVQPVNVPPETITTQEPVKRPRGRPMTAKEAIPAPPVPEPVIQPPAPLGKPKVNKTIKADVVLTASGHVKWW